MQIICWWEVTLGACLEETSQGGQRGASTSEESQASEEVEECPPSKELCEEVPAS